MYRRETPLNVDRLGNYPGSFEISDSTRRRTKHSTAGQSPGRARCRHGTLQLSGPWGCPVSSSSHRYDNQATEVAEIYRRQYKSRMTSESRCRNFRPSPVASIVRLRASLQSWTRPWVSWIEVQQHENVIGQLSLRVCSCMIPRTTGRAYCNLR
jgi:hypothetical protein